MRGHLDWILALGLGLASVFGFAPFGLPALPLIGLSILFLLWNRASPRKAATVGFVFGVGLFGTGASWVFVALHAFGGMPTSVAIIVTAVWVAYLSLWPALAGWVAARVTAPASAWRLVTCAGMWTLAEWVRGNGAIGFPWLVIGYSQSPGSPLSGYAPLGGVFMVSLAGALAAACVVAAIDAFGSARATVGIALCIAIFVVGFALSEVHWTRPVGTPLSVSLVQGDISEDVKFDPAFRDRSMTIYRNLVAESRGRLVVLPESAFPVFLDQIPKPILSDLARTAAERDGIVLLGVFTKSSPTSGSEDARYYNSVVALGSTARQIYRKRHLVPFGEYIPLHPLLEPLVARYLSIPLSDLTPGPEDQPLFGVGGIRIALTICYEDAFGGELVEAARNGGILINVTNDAWYGKSVAAWQHNQISRIRALELGRPMLRAANTGITTAIDANGVEIGRLPWFKRGVLEVEVSPREGMTPYARYGDVAVLLVAATVVSLAAIVSAWRSPTRRMSHNVDGSAHSTVGPTSTND